MFLFVNGNAFIALDDTKSCTLDLKLSLLNIKQIDFDFIVFFAGTSLEVVSTVR